MTKSSSAPCLSLLPRLSTKTVKKNILTLYLPLYCHYKPLADDNSIFFRENGAAKVIAETLKDSMDNEELCLHGVSVLTKIAKTMIDTSHVEKFFGDVDFGLLFQLLLKYIDNQKMCENLLEILKWMNSDSAKGLIEKIGKEKMNEYLGVVLKAAEKCKSTRVSTRYCVMIMYSFYKNYKGTKK